MALVALGGHGCAQIIGADGIRELSACDRGAIRCQGSARQKCSRGLIWEVAEDCVWPNPICTPEECLGVTQVATGNAHSCAVLTDHSIRCWGQNNNGQLGDGTTESRSMPTPVVSATADFTRVALGGSDDGGFTCAIHEDGHVSCLGDNSGRQLGGATDEPIGTTVPLPVPGLTDVTDLALGFQFGCALRKDNTLTCWGFNIYWPVATFGGLQPISGLTGVEEVTAGGEHLCVRSANKVLCWGINTKGQCGQDKSILQVNYPTAVTGISGATALAAGYFHTCALATNLKSPDPTQHYVHCWGSNMCGQLGDGMYCGEVCSDKKNDCGNSAPTPAYAWVPGVQIGAGAEHTCVLTDSGGSIECWGRNDFAQVSTTAASVLGVGDPFVEFPVPTLVQHASTLSVGPYHACAIGTTEVRCFGRNDFGQLGDGTTDTGAVVGVKWQ